MTTVSSRPRWIFFDIGGTLLEIQRPMSDIVHEHLALAGFDVPVERVRDSFKRVITNLPSRLPSFTSLDANTQWWERLFVELLQTTLPDEPLDVFHPVRESLRHHHRRGDNLGVYADAEGLVERLRAAGFRLGVISNWDDTLIDILERRGLLPHFDFVISSIHVGFEKPDPEIFAHALDRAGVAPEECAHVGDDWRCDILGAARVGIQPIWIERPKTAAVVKVHEPDDSPLPIEPIRLRSLEGLADWWR